MATCPHCGASSRLDHDAMKVVDILVARPLGTFSLAGTQMKVSAHAEHRLECRCGWHIDGRVNPETDTFEGDVNTQHFPVQDA